MKKPRVVMIATPSIDGKVDVQYAHALSQSVLECAQNDIKLVPIFIAYDSLIQRARNDLFKIAYNEDIDEMLFIDADMSWTVVDLMQLLSHRVDVVGGTYRKKSMIEEYVLRTLPTDTKLVINKEKLVEVSGLGTGFLKISKNVIKAVYESSDEYKQGDNKNRMVFNVAINDDGELMSEDIVFCNRIRELGFKVYLDPYVTCTHIGTAMYGGNLIKWATNNELIHYEE